MLLNSWSAVPPFTPAALAALGVTWLDPSDLSAMFQDLAGTTPAALEQPVGMILDKGQGLARGAELIPSPNFSGGSYNVAAGKDVPNGWTSYVVGNIASLTVAADSLQWSATADLAGVSLGGVLLSGKVQEITIRARRTSGSSSAALQVYTGTPVTWTDVVPAGAAAGTWYTKTLLAYTDGDYAMVLSNRNAAAGWEVSSVSVKAIAGNHAVQATSTARPKLKQDGNGKYYLAPDGVDDALNLVVPYSEARTTVITLSADGVSQGAFLAYDNAEKWEPWTPFAIQSPTTNFPATGYNAVHTYAYNRASAASGALSVDNGGPNVTATPPLSIGTNLGLGGKASLGEYASCRIYGLCIVNASLDAVTLAKLVKFLAQQGGQSL